MIKLGQRYRITSIGEHEGSFYPPIGCGDILVVDRRDIDMDCGEEEMYICGVLGKDGPGVGVCISQEDIDKGWIEIVDEVDEDVLEIMKQDGNLYVNIEQKTPIINKEGGCIDSTKTGFLSKEDMVKKPKHYLLFPEYGLEVKDVNKRILDNIEDSRFDITLYEAGWLQQALQYLMRAHYKNGIEDYEKAVETLQFVVDSMTNRKD